MSESDLTSLLILSYASSLCVLAWCEARTAAALRALAQQERPSAIPRPRR